MLGQREQRISSRPVFRRALRSVRIPRHLYAVDADALSDSSSTFYTSNRRAGRTLSRNRCNGPVICGALSRGLAFEKCKARSSKPWAVVVDHNRIDQFCDCESPLLRSLLFVPLRRRRLLNLDHRVASTHGALDGENDFRRVHRFGRRGVRLHPTLCRHDPSTVATLRRSRLRRHQGEPPPPEHRLASSLESICHRGLLLSRAMARLARD